MLICYNTEIDNLISLNDRQSNCISQLSMPSTDLLCAGPSCLAVVGCSHINQSHNDINQQRIHQQNRRATYLIVSDVTAAILVDDAPHPV